MQEQWRQQGGYRLLFESVKESREPLTKVIEGWARLASLEQLFAGVRIVVPRICSMSCDREG
jgi:hypothetical protein